MGIGTVFSNPETICNKVYYYTLNQGKNISELNITNISYYNNNYYSECYLKGYSPKLPKKDVILIVNNTPDCTEKMNVFFKDYIEIPKKVFIGNEDSCKNLNTINYLFYIENNDGWINGIKIWFIFLMLFIVLFIWFIISNSKINKLILKLK